MKTQNDLSTLAEDQNVIASLKKMETTVEDLKLLAEVMGLSVAILNNVCYYQQDEKLKIAIEWNPVKNAGQCIQMLEWLRDEMLFSEWELLFCEIWNYKNFKTAVVMAAIEYVKK